MAPRRRDRRARYDPDPACDLVDLLASVAFEDMPEPENLEPENLEPEEVGALLGALLLGALDRHWSTS